MTFCFPQAFLSNHEPRNLIFFNENWVSPNLLMWICMKTYKYLDTHDKTLHVVCYHPTACEMLLYLASLLLFQGISNEEGGEGIWITHLPQLHVFLGTLKNSFSTRCCQAQAFSLISVSVLTAAFQEEKGHRACKCHIFISKSIFDLWCQWMNNILILCLKGPTTHAHIAVCQYRGSKLVNTDLFFSSKAINMQVSVSL